MARIIELTDQFIAGIAERVVHEIAMRSPMTNDLVTITRVAVQQALSDARLNEYRCEVVIRAQSESEARSILQDSVLRDTACALRGVSVTGLVAQ